MKVYIEQQNSKSVLRIAMYRWYFKQRPTNPFFRIQISKSCWNAYGNVTSEFGAHSTRSPWLHKENQQ